MPINFHRSIIATCAAFVFACASDAAAQAAPCGPTAPYVCNQAGPEDLAVIRGGKWVIASGQVANGAVRLINVADRSTTVVFPAANGKVRLDAARYPSCPGPVDPTEG